jgi:hypothetical protein
LFFKNRQQGNTSFIYDSIQRIVHLLIPYSRKDFQWNAAPHAAIEAYGNFTQFLLHHFDTDNDGK